MKIINLLKTRKLYAVVVTAAVAMLIGLNKLQFQGPLLVPQMENTHLKFVASQPRQSIHPTITSDLRLMVKETEPDAAQTSSDIALLSKRNQAWHAADGRSPAPEIPLNERIAEYAVVNLDQNPVNFPRKGQQVELSMLNGEKLLVEVEQTLSNANGDYTWTGHLQDQGGAYPVVMTYGAHSTFATITTSEGTYSLESVKGVGWLYKNPSEFELSDAASQDFLEIPAH